MCLNITRLFLLKVLSLHKLKKKKMYFMVIQNMHTEQFVTKQEEEQKLDDAEGLSVSNSVLWRGSWCVQNITLHFIFCVLHLNTYSGFQVHSETNKNTKVESCRIWSNFLILSVFNVHWACGSLFWEYRLSHWVHARTIVRIARLALTASVPLTARSS